MTYGDIRLPYAIDMDETLAKSVWPKRGIGAPIKKNLVKVREIAAAGHLIAIHTSRPWSDYPLVEDWLRKHDIPFDQIICGKFLACKYIDDKNVSVEEESWL